MYTTMVFSYSAIISQVDLRHSTDAARPRYRDNGRSKNLGGFGCLTLEQVWYIFRSKSVGAMATPAISAGSVARAGL